MAPEIIIRLPNTPIVRDILQRFADRCAERPSDSSNAEAQAFADTYTAIMIALQPGQLEDDIDSSAETIRR